jgi:hypothetical protein
MKEVAEPTNREIAHLAYTRRFGWSIVEWREWKDSYGRDDSGWCLRHGSGRLRGRYNDSRVLAWAELPPITESAA